MLDPARSFIRRGLARPAALAAGALAATGIAALALLAVTAALGSSGQRPPSAPIDASTATLLGLPPGFEIVDDAAARDIQSFVEVARISDFAAYAQFVAYAEAVQRLDDFARLTAYADAVVRLEREEAERRQAAAAPAPRPAAGPPPAFAPASPRPAPRTAPAPTPAPPPAASAAAGLDTSPMTALERGLFDAINRRRASAGMGALRANPSLVGVARIRSRDMAANGYFAHTSPVTGDDAFTLMTAYGVPYAWAGENLAMNNYPAGECVAVADDALWNSPPHRQNSLGANYTDMGVAVATTAEGMHYFTVIFTGN